MKKRYLSAFALMLGIAMVSACSGKTAETESQVQTGDARTAGGAGEYVAADYVTLGDYKGLTITATPATYEDKDYEIQTK